MGAAKDITWSKSRNSYYGTVDGGASFFVGVQVSYSGRVGLMNELIVATQTYDPTNFPAFGFWAEFMVPTAMCESHCSFQCLNTYDRAAFTFGFLQFAAHLPDGDFVKWFRSVLGLSDAPQWFPDIILANDRIVKDTGVSQIVLEDQASTQKLMDFLNPTADVINTDEIVNSAKFIAWQAVNPKVAELQVSAGVYIFRNYMRIFAKKYNLDGKVDAVCAAVCDIRHQGRGSSAEIMAALRSNDPLDALLEIGSSSYADRCTTLRAEINKKVKAGIFGKYQYSAVLNDFAPVAGGAP